MNAAQASIGDWLALYKVGEPTQKNHIHILYTVLLYTDHIQCYTHWGDVQDST